MAGGHLKRARHAETLVGIPVLTRVSALERVKGIEPSLSAWEVDQDRGLPCRLMSPRGT